MSAVATNPFESKSLPVRHEFGATQAMEKRGEMAATAVAAQARAMIESRYVMAMRNPRNLDQVRQDLLKECRRPSFANNKSALYHKPIGKGVEGLGIRFVEVALRCYKNVLAESTMTYSDDEREIHRVCVTDLENNNSWPLDITVSKTVERSKPMDDGTYISVRTNSYGKQTYTVPATDEDLLNKRQALISKALRTCGLRIIPGDLQDEAEEVIRAIRMDEAAKDPNAERKKIADAFAELNVKASELEKYLGHALDACTPAELVQLRGLYGALRDGEANWTDALEVKRAQREGSGAAGDQAPAGSGDKLKAATRTAAKRTAKSGPEGSSAGKPPAAAAPGGESGTPPGAVKLDEDDPFAAITDEAKALLAMDKAKDEGEGSAVLQRCAGQVFRPRIVDAFNKRFASEV